MSSFESISGTAGSATGVDTGASTDPCIKCDEMKTSVKPYDRHVVLCLPHLSLSPDEAIGMKWPSKVEEIPLVAHITERLSAAKDNGVFLKVTACDYNNYKDSIDGGAACSDCANDWVGMSQISFILYPEAVIVDVPAAVTEATEGAAMSPLDLFLAWAVRPNSSAAELASLLESCVADGAGPAVIPVPWTKLILVCTHANRDKRCGRAGPQVVQALQKEITECLAVEAGADSLGAYRVVGSSHIGGHKFAGTLLVYPEGDWFGRVSKSSAKALLQHIRNRAAGPAAATEADTVVRTKCFRGNGFCASDSDREW